MPRKLRDKYKDIFQKGGLSTFGIQPVNMNVQGIDPNVQRYQLNTQPLDVSSAINTQNILLGRDRLALQRDELGLREDELDFKKENLQFLKDKSLRDFTMDMLKMFQVEYQVNKSGGGGGAGSSGLNPAYGQKYLELTQDFNNRRIEAQSKALEAGMSGDLQGAKDALFDFQKGMYSDQNSEYYKALGAQSIYEDFMENKLGKDLKAGTILNTNKARAVVEAFHRYANGEGDMSLSEFAAVAQDDFFINEKAILDQIDGYITAFKDVKDMGSLEVSGLDPNVLELRMKSPQMALDEYNQLVVKSLMSDPDAIEYFEYKGLISTSLDENGNVVYDADKEYVGQGVVEFMKNRLAPYEKTDEQKEDGSTERVLDNRPSAASVNHVGSSSKSSSGVGGAPKAFDKDGYRTDIQSLGYEGGTAGYKYAIIAERMGADLNNPHNLLLIDMIARRSEEEPEQNIDGEMVGGPMSPEEIEEVMKQMVPVPAPEAVTGNTIIDYTPAPVSNVDNSNMTEGDMFANVESPRMGYLAVYPSTIKGNSSAVGKYQFLWNSHTDRIKSTMMEEGIGPVAKWDDVPDIVKEQIDGNAILRAKPVSEKKWIASYLMSGDVQEKLFERFLNEDYYPDVEKVRSWMNQNGRNGNLWTNEELAYLRHWSGGTERMIDFLEDGVIDNQKDVAGSDRNLTVEIVEALNKFGYKNGMNTGVMMKEYFGQAGVPVNQFFPDEINVLFDNLDAISEGGGTMMDGDGTPDSIGPSTIVLKETNGKALEYLTRDESGNIYFYAMIGDEPMALSDANGNPTPLTPNQVAGYLNASQLIDRATAVKEGLLAERPIKTKPKSNAAPGGFSIHANTQPSALPKGAGQEAKNEEEAYFNDLNQRLSSAASKSRPAGTDKFGRPTEAIDNSEEVAKLQSLKDRAEAVSNAIESAPIAEPVDITEALFPQGSRNTNVTIRKADDGEVMIEISTGATGGQGGVTRPKTDINRMRKDQVVEFLMDKYGK